MARRLLSYSTLAAALLLALILPMSSCQGPQPPSAGPATVGATGPAPTAALATAAPGTPTAATAAGQAIPQGATQAKVVKVVDGDTIDVEIAGQGVKRLRYIGINTPESVDPRRPVEVMGEEASRKNREIVGGQTVWLEKDVSETDQYGRLLRYVYLADGRMVNEELLRLGYAQVVSFPPDVKHLQRFRAIEQGAKQAARGLWGPVEMYGGNQPQQVGLATSTPTPAPVAPNASSGASPCQAGQIKGNRNSMTYHAPGQADYENTRANVQCFNTEAEAQAAGYRRAPK